MQSTDLVQADAGETEYREQSLEYRVPSSGYRYCAG